MNKKKVFIVFLFLFLLSIALVYIASNNIRTPKGKIGVVVSVGPQVEFVKAVGGDRVDVTLMVPSGADPHTYEPLPHQLKAVSQAQIYALVGTPLEFEITYLDRLKTTNPNLLMINTSQGVALIPSTDNEGSDPHVWVSPRNAKIMVENIYQGLVQVDPENQAYYQKNRDQYLSKLDELDNNITHSLKKKENRKIMVYHPAWAYFCRDYGLEQITVESDGKEPTSQKLADLVVLARINNINVIFVEPQFSNKSAQIIATEIGGRVVIVDSLAENYLENMRKVAQAFAQS